MPTASERPALRPVARLPRRPPKCFSRTPLHPGPSPRNARATAHPSHPPPAPREAGFVPIAWRSEKRGALLEPVGPPPRRSALGHEDPCESTSTTSSFQAGPYPTTQTVRTDRPHGPTPSSEPPLISRCRTFAFSLNGPRRVRNASPFGLQRRLDCVLVRAMGARFFALTSLNRGPYHSLALDETIL